MTSAADFKLISWKNFFGLSAIVVGVLIPVGMRYYFRQELKEVAAVEGQQAAEDEDVDDVRMQPGCSNAKGPGALVLLSDDENDGPDYDDDGRSVSSDELAAEEDELLPQRKEKGVAVPAGWRLKDVGSSSK